MSTIAEIEQAIETLPAAQYAELLAWIDERHAAEVDARFEEAVLSGKFDPLAREAESAADTDGSVPLETFLREQR